METVALFRFVSAGTHNIGFFYDFTVGDFLFVFLQNDFRVFVFVFGNVEYNVLLGSGVICKKKSFGLGALELESKA